MAEETEKPESGEEIAAGDPAAMALALGSASRSKADAYLDEQRKLTGEQRHHLKAQFGLKLWELRLGILLRIATACVGLAVAAALIFLVWDARESRALVIEPFFVPPDMAAKGLDGSVLAGQLLDKLNQLRADTDKEVQSSGYSADGGGAVKLEIPETGISLGELSRILHEWLGHDITISGGLVRGASGLTLTTRTADSAATFSGPEDTLDHMVAQGAESILAATQPLSYVDYLRSNQRHAEAETLLRRLISQGSVQDRAWAYSELGEVLEHFKQYDAAENAFHAAAELDGDLWVVWEDLGNAENFDRNDEEDGFRDRQKAANATNFGGADPESARHFHLDDEVYIDEARGDFSGALALQSGEAGETTEPDLAYQSSYLAAYEAGYLHDVRQSQLWQQRAEDRAFAVRGGGFARNINGVLQNRLAYWRDVTLGEWSRAADEMEFAENRTTGDSSYWRALQAVALVHARRLDAARDLLARQPDKCHYCIIARGLLAEYKSDRPAADRFFARELKDYPSIARGNEYWGQVKLGRGDYAGAASIFAAIHAKAPHFADPLEMWGEALMAQNHSDLALAKFKEANGYAPNWGKLHLKWGEALFYAGKTDDAKKQFAIAAGLALSTAEKAELAKMSHV
jgi:tetratricopeptide (TPR) repeat protein